MAAFAVKTPPQHGTWDQFLDVWRAADEIETFESAWTMDHFYPLTPPVEGPQLESWALLAALANATRRLRLGCMVNGMHYRHPAVTANAAVTVDHISRGRFTLGLGAGWHEPESRAYGIPLGTMTERFDRFDEGVQVIRSLLTDEVSSFSGRYYRLTDALCNPKPVQEHLPIAIGGRGPRRTLRAVARWADHWDALAGGTVDDWVGLDGVLADHCAAVGRDPGEITRSVHVMWEPADDPAALADTAAAYGDAGVDLVIFSMRGPYEARLLEPLAQALRSRSG